MGDERAAMRDASFYAHLRVPVVGGYVPRYHIVAANGQGPVCDPNGMLLVVDDANVGDCTRDAKTVPNHMRCQRPGCARRWPGFVR